MSNYETWLAVICDGGDPPDPTVFFSSSPTSQTITADTTLCSTCENGTVTGYRWRPVGSTTWTVVNTSPTSPMAALCPVLTVAVVAVPRTSPVQAGDLIDYTVTVTNNGTGPTINPAVTSSLALVLNTNPNLGVIAANGGTAQTTITYAVTAADAAAQTVSNTVTASDVDCDGNPVTAMDTASTPVDDSAPAQSTVIELDMTGAAIPAADMPAIQEAVDILNRVFTQPLAPAAITGDAAYTGIKVQVNTVATLDAIATAGPTTLRPGPLGLTGVVNWNLEFLAGGVNALPAASITDVMIHELLHVVGFISTFITPAGLAVNGDCGPDTDPDTADDVSPTQYTGALALERYRLATGNIAEPFIPMQCSSPAHWAEGPPVNTWPGLSDETMSPYVDTPSRLSAISIAVLDDLNYPGISYVEAELWP